MPASQAPMAAGTRPPIPATVWVLGLVSLAMDISSEMVQTLLPIYLVTELAASALAIGFIEGLAVAVAMVTRLFSGVVSDWTSKRKPLAVLGYGLGAVSKPMIPLAGSLGWIVAAKALDRIGKGIRGAPRDALIADTTPPEIRGAAFGLRKSLDTVGGFVGPLVAIGLMLATGGDILTVFWIATIPAFLAVALLVVGISEPAQPAAPAKERPRLAAAGRLNRTTWAMIAVACLFTMARFSEAFLLLKSQEVGLATAWVPITMVVMHAVYGLAAYPVGRLSDRTGRMGPLAISLVLLLAADLVLAQAGTLLPFFAGIVLWGLHMGFSQGILATLIADAAPAQLKATAFGVFNLMTGLTVLMGNIAAGWLWQAHGSSATFLASGALAALALLAFLLLRETWRPA
ncbi:MFS transporter [Ancylobacter defluvii]|uniref:MFS transporter n=1 Tax=Ancylobacter defluvii TaxID=1282440 RepID=A0A9W6JTK2_9HYPH|nr:MFS transporter [Ancylobacter defluvii]MBS7587359.1 MFS transporter [Ancylobacter defluvii]GLK82049.1 MFS transporter [Ancylobacter defluvii]